MLYMTIRLQIYFQNNVQVSERKCISKMTCVNNVTPNTYFQCYNNWKINLFFPVIYRMTQELKLSFTEALNV